MFSDPTRGDMLMCNAPVRHAAGTTLVFLEHRSALLLLVVLLLVVLLLVRGLRRGQAQRRWVRPRLWPPGMGGCMRAWLSAARNALSAELRFFLSALSPGV